MKRIRLHSWVEEECEGWLKLSLLESPYRIPKLEILFQKDMSYTCAVFGWLRPESHIYTKFHRLVENVTVSELLGFITSYDLCNGLDIKQRCYPDSVMNHVILCELDLNLPSSSLSTPQNVKEFKRENGCYILIRNNDSPCPVCSKCIKKIR